MHEYLNELSINECRQELQRCCGSSRWVTGMLAHHPFKSTEEVLEKSLSVWNSLERSDFLEAFEHHPQIGASLNALREKFQSTESWSTNEQQSVQNADDNTLKALAQGNSDYLNKFGYIFIVCATGKSAQEMLGLLQERLENPPELEIEISAAEQAKITQLRLEKLTR